MRCLDVLRSTSDYKAKGSTPSALLVHGSNKHGGTLSGRVTSGKKMIPPDGWHAPPECSRDQGNQFMHRWPEISIENCIRVFNELKSNNQIDAKGHAPNSSIIQTYALNNPSAYPTIVHFINQWIMGMVTQIGASNAEHGFHSDLNSERLIFLK